MPAAVGLTAAWPYPEAAQAQPAPAPPPQQPPPPAMAEVSPLEPVENDRNTDSWRLESLPQSGQFAGSSISLIGRSLSKTFEQMVQAYSYMGISVL